MAGTPRDRIENLRQRIEKNDDITEADQEDLIAFSDHLDLLAQTYSNHRHEKLLRHCTIIAEELDGELLTNALDDRDAAEAIVAWINCTYENEETNRDYRSVLPSSRSVSPPPMRESAHQRSTGSRLEPPRTTTQRLILWICSGGTNTSSR